MSNDQYFPHTGTFTNKQAGILFALIVLFHCLLMGSTLLVCYLSVGHWLREPWGKW